MSWVRLPSLRQRQRLVRINTHLPKFTCGFLQSPPTSSAKDAHGMNTNVSRLPGVCHTGVPQGEIRQLSHSQAGAGRGAQCRSSLPITPQGWESRMPRRYPYLMAHPAGNPRPVRSSRFSGTASWSQLQVPVQ